MSEKAEDEKESTFLLLRRHEHDGHVEAPHARQTAEGLQDGGRRFIPAPNRPVLAVSQSERTKAARLLRLRLECLPYEEIAQGSEDLVEQVRLQRVLEDLAVR